MNTKTAPPFTDFLAFKHWPTWVGLFLLWIVAYLPFIIRLKIGSAIGYLTYCLARERRYITHLNLTLCFPELTPQEHLSLTRKSFRENGIGLIETTTGWVRGAESFHRMSTFIGREHIDKALAKGKGVLLLGAHYSTLDFGANLLAQHYSLGVTYRAHKNPLFDAFMLRGRLKNCSDVFDRSNIRGAFKHLKKGLILWYAPDQDYGPEHAVYAPFFGVSAATITTASRFADINNSPTLLLRTHRVGDSPRYEVEFVPFPEEFPSDDQEDAVTINKILESAIRTYPEQYLWMHKRFKTQAMGKPASPYIDIKTSSRKISPERYHDLIADAVSVTDEGSNQGEMQLDSSLHLRIFPGSITKFTGLKHPARRFDYYAKKLRLKNIPSVTSNAIFRVPAMGLTAISYFEPKGLPLDTLLQTLPTDQFPLKELAILFSALHQHGFQLNDIKPHKLVLSSDGFNIQNPDDISISSGMLNNQERYESLQTLLSILALEQTEMERLITYYLDEAGLKGDEDFLALLSDYLGIR